MKRHRHKWKKFDGSDIEVCMTCGKVRREKK